MQPCCLPVFDLDGFLFRLSLSGDSCTLASLGLDPGTSLLSERLLPTGLLIPHWETNSPNQYWLGELLSHEVLT